MLFNIPLPNTTHSDNVDFNSIKGYLSALNEQLRFLMLNIDEENLSENLLNTINNTASAVQKWSVDGKINGSEVADGTVSPSKLPLDCTNKNDLSANTYGLNIGKELTLNKDGDTCNITVNNNGLLTFSQGTNTVPFSLALVKNDGKYFFFLFDPEGNAVGNIPLQELT